MQTITIGSDEIPEVENLDLDDDVTIVLKGKVTRLAKDNWDHPMPEDGPPPGTVFATFDVTVSQMEVGEVSLDGAVKKAAQKLKTAEGSLRVRNDISPG